LTLLAFEEAIKFYRRRNDPTVVADVTSAAQPENLEVSMAS
jgi:hypothetical protein